VKNRPPASRSHRNRAGQGLAGGVAAAFYASQKQVPNLLAGAYARLPITVITLTRVVQALVSPPPLVTSADKMAADGAALHRFTPELLEAGFTASRKD
jgi:hypothetical protein